MYLAHIFLDTVYLLYSFSSNMLHIFYIDGIIVDLYEYIIHYTLYMGFKRQQ